MKDYRLGYGNGCLVRQGKTWSHRFKRDNNKITVVVIKNKEGKSVQDKKEAHEIIMKQLEKKAFVEKLSKEQIELQIEKTKKTIKKTIVFKLSELWKRYDNSLNRIDSSAGTLKSYKHSCEFFLKWLNDNYPKITNVDEINEDIASSFLTHYASTGITNRSYNIRLQALNLIFKTLLDDENPFKTFKCKKTNSNSYKPFSIEQLNKIFKTLDDDNHYMLYKSEMKTLIHFSLYTGCRLADASLVKWKYIDFENNTISFIPIKTKSNGKSVTIPINPALLTELNKHKDNDSEYVLSNVSKRYLANPSGIPKDIKKLLTSSGIETYSDVDKRITQYSFHSFRHTFVSLTMNAGFGIETIKSIVGHSNIAMTSHYAQIDRENKKKAVNSLNLKKIKVIVKKNQVAKETLILNLIKKLTKDKFIIKEAEEILKS